MLRMKQRSHLFLAALLFALAAPFVQATDLTNFLENKIVDHYFRTTAYSPAGPWYVGLATAASDCEAGTVTEVSGGSYARVSVSKADASWKGTHGSASGASSGTNGTISNAAAITFAAPSANWGTVTHFFINDASSAGNYILCRALTTSKTINNGDAAPSFAADALTIQIDN